MRYFYPPDIAMHIGGRDFWRDTEEDVTFAVTDAVLNVHPLSDIIPKLESVAGDVHRGGFLDIMIHEEYFYEDYVNYIPDFNAIVETACRWAYENGYRGAFMKDTMFEKTASK